MLNKTKIAAAVIAFGSLAAAGTLHAQKKPVDIVTVVKITGISWFNRMEVGVKEFAAANVGVVNARQIGPAQSDAAQQQRLVEDLVAKKVDAIAVVSMDPLTLEPALKKALDRGIKVVTHEAENQKNTLVDVEAFNNTAYGARLNERLAACMGQSGKWSSLLGSLGSQSQLQWANGGRDNAKKYPKMTLVDPNNETANDAEKAYTKAKEVLRKHPDLKGFQGSSSLDVLGIGRAVEEAGLTGKICVYGTGLPSEAAKFLESGAVNGIAFWDPKDAGIVMNKAALLLVQGKKITDGMDMGVSGYDHVTVKKGPGVGVILTGKAWVEVDKSNYKKYAF
jgi:simple sugar transport system substrate-binding protein